MDDKAYVLMAWPWDEVWGPCAVFTDKAEAERAKDILAARIHGNNPDHDYPEFDIRTVDLNPTIQNTGKRRLMKAAEEPDEDDMDMTLGDAVDGEWVDAIDVYNLVTSLERGDPEYRLEASDE